MITVDSWLTSYLYSETEIETATNLEVQLSWISNSFSANVFQLNKPRQVCCITINSKYILKVQILKLNQVNFIQGRRYRGGVGGWNTPPTRQQIGKLLSQSAKLYWLKIPTEETTY
jgi:hypothetical protein